MSTHSAFLMLFIIPALVSAGHKEMLAIIEVRRFPPFKNFKNYQAKPEKLWREFGTKVLTLLNVPLDKNENFWIDYFTGSVDLNIDKKYSKLDETEILKLMKEFIDTKFPSPASVMRGYKKGDQIDDSSLYDIKREYFLRLTPIIQRLKFLMQQECILQLNRIVKGTAADTGVKFYPNLLIEVHKMVTDKFLLLSTEYGVEAPEYYAMFGRKLDRMAMEFQNDELKQFQWWSMFPGHFNEYLIDEMRFLILNALTVSEGVETEFWIYNFNSLVNYLHRSELNKNNPKVFENVFALLKEYDQLSADPAFDPPQKYLELFGCFCAGFFNEFYGADTDWSRGLQSAKRFLEFDNSKSEKLQTLLEKYLQRDPFPMISLGYHGESIETNAIYAADILRYCDMSKIDTFYHEHIVTNFESMAMITIPKRKTIEFTKELFLSGFELLKGCPDFFAAIYRAYLWFVIDYGKTTKKDAWGVDFDAWINANGHEETDNIAGYIPLKLYTMLHGRWDPKDSAKFTLFKEPEAKGELLNQILSLPGWQGMKKFVIDSYLSLFNPKDRSKVDGVTIFKAFNGKTISFNDFKGLSRVHGIAKMID